MKTSSRLAIAIGALAVGGVAARASERTLDSLRQKFGADAVTSGRILRAKAAPRGE